jgi:hypothetical protein
MAKTPAVMARNMRVTHKPPITGISRRNTLHEMKKIASNRITIFLLDLFMD